VISEEGKGSDFIVILELSTNKNVTHHYSSSIDSFSLSEAVSQSEESLEEISKEERDNLFKKLIYAIERKRPNEFEPIIKRLELVVLESEDKVKLEITKKLLKKYDFKMALEVLDEK